MRFFKNNKLLKLSILALLNMGCVQEYGLGINYPGLDENGNPIDPNNPPVVPPEVTGHNEDRSQSFNIAPSSQSQKIDLLFVIDNSGSMEDEQNNLTSAFDSFIGNFQDLSTNRDIDFQIGVISTDTSEAPLNLDNKPEWISGAYSDIINQGPGSLLYKDGNDKILKSSELSISALSQQFQENAKLLDSLKLANNDWGSSYEMAAGATIAALSNELSSWNAGLVRPDALLSIIILSDEDETLNNNGQTYVKTNATATAQRFAAFEAAVLQAKNNQRGLVRVDSVVSKTQCNQNGKQNKEGKFYMELAPMWSGTNIDICEDFTIPLDNLGGDIAIQVQSKFALAEKAVSVPSVYLNNVKLTQNVGFTFDSKNSAIQLIGDALTTIQNADAVLNVDYEVFVAD